jgi:hypothetical protein
MDWNSADNRQEQQQQQQQPPMDTRQQNWGDPASPQTDPYVSKDSLSQQYTPEDIDKKLSKYAKRPLIREQPLPDDPSNNSNRPTDPYEQRIQKLMEDKKRRQEERRNRYGSFR